MDENMKTGIPPSAEMEISVDEVRTNEDAVEAMAILGEEHVIKFVEGGKRYAASRKKLRELVKCACGCGTLIETPDSKGRTKRFAHGHNARGTHWRWSKNGKNDKDSVV